MALRDGCASGNLGHPVSHVRIAVFVPENGRSDDSAAELVQIDEFLRGGHSEISVTEGCGSVAGVFHMGDRNVVEVLSALGGDDNHTVGTAGTVDSGSGTILEHVHRGDFIRRDIVDVAYRHSVHNVERAGTCTLVESGETANLHAETCRCRV